MNIGFQLSFDFDKRVFLSLHAILYFVVQNLVIDPETKLD